MLHRLDACVRLIRRTTGDGNRLPGDVLLAQIIRAGRPTATVVFHPAVDAGRFQTRKALGAIAGGLAAALRGRRRPAAA